MRGTSLWLPSPCPVRRRLQLQSPLPVLCRGAVGACSALPSYNLPSLTALELQSAAGTLRLAELCWQVAAAAHLAATLTQGLGSRPEVCERLGRGNAFRIAASCSALFGPAAGLLHELHRRAEQLVGQARRRAALSLVTLATTLVASAAAATKALKTLPGNQLAAVLESTLF